MNLEKVFGASWTVARQVPLSMDSPGKNTRVGCHALHQGIFPTQGSHPGLPHCRWILYHFSYQGSPISGGKRLMGKQQNWENILLTAKGEKKQNKTKFI